MGGPCGRAVLYRLHGTAWKTTSRESLFATAWDTCRQPVPLIENGRVFGGYYNPNSTLARSCGHLLVASVGTKICALDPWRASGNSPTSQSCWSQDLAEAATDNFGNVVFINRGVDQDFRANPFGPVNARYVCFLRRRSIVAVDPLTRRAVVGAAGYSSRQRRFRRRTICVRAAARQRRSVGLSGDRRPTAGHPQSAAAQVREKSITNDGSIGSPAFRRCPIRESISSAVMSSLGSEPRRGPYNGSPRAGLVRSLAAEGGLAVAEICLGGPTCRWSADEAVGVLEPGGHFVLVALADGRTIADLKLEVRRFPATDLLVTRMGDQYIVLANDNRARGDLGQRQ